MSMRVLFNGAVLVRPGASTKIDASQFQNIVLNGLGTVGLIGEAESGAPHVLGIWTSPEDVKAEFVSGDLVDAAAIVAAPGNDPRIPAGAATIVTYKVNASTQALYAHPVSPNTIHTFKSKKYGFAANMLSVALAVGGSANERVITITGPDDFGVLQSEVSPSLGATGKFTMQYTGASTACTVTITATTLTTTTASPNTPAEDLNLTLSDFASLNDLVVYINNLASYSATALVTNAVSFNPLDLDAVVALNVKTLATLFSLNFDLANWVNLNSSFITDTLTRGKVGPAAILTTTPLAGGTRGTSANSDWVAAFLAMRSVRINQMVPLASENALGATPAGGAGRIGDTYTYASILASAVAHAKFVSSTAGRNECQAWSGMKGTKTEIIAAANGQNSEHLCLVGQKLVRQRASDAEIATLPEWATACALAGMRAGAQLGEPLTWKYLLATGVTSDPSWKETDNDDCTDMALNGVMVINSKTNKGFRLDKGITTFTKLDNDAYTEETVVQIWKAIGYDLRTALEDAFVGTGGTLDKVQTAPAVMKRVLEPQRQAGAITDSLIDGVRTPAYRNMTAKLSGDVLSAGVTITPTPGINFVLNTIVLVPAASST
jgi:hypothetical protein